jgi:hypothetical protein
MEARDGNDGSSQTKLQMVALMLGMPRSRINCESGSDKMHQSPGAWTDAEDIVHSASDLNTIFAVHLAPNQFKSRMSEANNEAVQKLVKSPQAVSSANPLETNGQKISHICRLFPAFM